MWVGGVGGVGGVSGRGGRVRHRENPVKSNFKNIHARGTFPGMLFHFVDFGCVRFLGLVRYRVLGPDCATQPSPRREKSRTRGNNGMEKWRAISPTRMARTLAAKVKPLATNTGMEKWSATPGKVPHAWRTWPNKGRSPCGELRSARGPLFCAYKGSLPLRLFGPLSSPSSAGL